MDCVFCRITADKQIIENEHFFAIRDIHPFTRGHCLIVSKRHATDFFELDPSELQSLHDISIKLRGILDAEFHPDGYNLLMNCGHAAWQSIYHYHMHVIPQYSKGKRSLLDLGRHFRG
jgi:diadenosine tetraphosphate (Ap4A) HIT family hydrolase